MELEQIHAWLTSLSADYSVNPYIFAAIYLGAIPFFTASVAWVIRNRRRNKPIAFPLLSTGFFLSSAYIYLLVAGENVPVWVYFVVAVLLGYGIYATYRRVIKKQRDNAL